MKEIHDEGIRRPEKYRDRPPVDRAFCDAAVDFVLTRINANLEPFCEQFPAPASRGGIYPAIGNTEWTSAFWTGMLWLAYELTGSEKYRGAAEKQLPGYERRLTGKINTATHDLGFLYTLSCVAAYKLTGNKDAMTSAMEAAELLVGRYFEKAGIIQAWGDLGDPEQRGRMIIDCLMNLPLLYWVAQAGGGKEYYKIAYSHALQAARHIVREDASTFHTFYMDVETGAPRFGKTAQGYSDNSCWSRGQAWGIYGFMLSYVYTGDGSFLETARKLADYFLNRLPADYTCYWDLVFTNGDEERDSSAAAIAACGLLELAKHLPLTDACRTLYENAAMHIVYNLALKYTTAGMKSNGVLGHAVYNKPKHEGVDECVIWGDYFYLEALTRLVKDWRLYW